MKTLVYVTENCVLHTKDFTDMIDYQKVEITDPYLIVGIFENGLFLSPLEHDLSEYDLKPLEKYLMCSTNVDFKISTTEFRTPNIPFLFGSIPPPIPDMFLNPLRIYSTRSRTSYPYTELLSISVPATGTVKLYLDGFEEKDLGEILAMPDPVPSGFDYEAWDNLHTFDVTDTAVDVLDLTNISFTLTIRGQEFYLTPQGLDYLTYVDNSKTIGTITSPYTEFDDVYNANVLKLSVNWISAADARTNPDYKVFNYRKPGQSDFTSVHIVTSLLGGTFVMEAIVYEIFNSYDLHANLPIGTEFYFSDLLSEFTETNHKLII